MGAPAVPETGRERNQAELPLCRLPGSGCRTLLAAFGFAVARPAMPVWGPSPQTPTAGRRILLAVARPAMPARGASPRIPTAPADVGGTVHGSRASRSAN